MSTQGNKEEALETLKMVVRVARWVLAIPLLLIGIPLSSTASPFLIAVGALLMVPELVEVFSQGAGNILWNSRPGKPIPMYGIPETRAAEGNYEAAIEEYDAIIDEFPDEVKPYNDVIEIACRHLNDAELALEYHDRGINAFKKDPEKQAKIEVMYKANRTFLRDVNADDKGVS